LLEETTLEQPGRLCNSSNVPSSKLKAKRDAEELPESVPDDWLDQKPFDPAGR
jgi:hypothetical protein